ncbi:putative adenylate/guanylate cyclase [Thalassoporum mexicanum PCC 7367]|uniref:adenylate/guanylate cyclase domain-containing protein n=1 Tax=Thalassoporum mexicanum TaxID=3457544 RepID=UPI00029FF67E|nr:adenylate/guanylate cyclase domain-containing protein [Pseudanabaena sp. PCC 7367]AFY68607.1 putative adenylate/guanylate cyclase [Pseudanabaena sp. PCC 7367]
MEQEAITSTSKSQRTLAAIALTDGVNFNNRITENEAHTLGLINRDLQFMRDHCGQFEGKVLRSTGSGLLMYFPSAIDAVKCALEIQTTFGQAASTLAPTDVLSHRIGIQLGDIYISETDATGTGVNIAARLQMEAEPGTICVSQTVYDVVKNSLELNAEFLGEQEIQNITGSIGIYLLRPASVQDHNGNDQALITETSIKTDDHAIAPATPGVDMELFDEIVANLEQSSDLLRIKRLILFACMNKWETSQEKLDKLSLKGLIAELIEITQTTEKLKELLSSIVHGTSKPDLYAQVADSIISEVGWLYAGFQASAQSQPALIPQASILQTSGSSDRVATPILERSAYNQLAESLMVSDKTNRIKKIIYYLSRGTWENNINSLDIESLGALLQELHRLNPTLESLELALSEIIKLISKPREYTAAASTLVRILHPLYDPPGTEKNANTNTNTNAFTGQNEVVPFIVNAPAGADSTQGDQEYANQPNPELESPEAAEHFDPHFDREVAIAQMALFDLRLTIIKYVTPLRAKLLCFYALYENYGNNAQNNQDLNQVRNYEFDDLLRELISKYEDLENLNQKLLATASQFEDTDQYTQAAQVLISALKPIYQELNPEPQ